MLSHNYTYESCLRTSESVYWSVADVFAGRSFDLSRRLLPDSLAGVEAIECLDAAEKRKLNQIRGVTYAHIGHFVEDFLTAEAMRLASAHQLGDRAALRALLRFAEEEIKHQAMFTRARELIEEGLGVRCQLIGGSTDVAHFILSKSPLAGLLLASMIEWMTQRHFVDAVKESREELDPLFVDLLKLHWVEEAQHAKLDSLEIDRIAGTMGPDEREAAIDELLEIGGAFDGLLGAQVDLDIQTLEQVTRTFTAAEREEIGARQRRAYRYTFLVSGLTCRPFQQIVAELTREGPAKIAGAAAALSA